VRLKFKRSRNVVFGVTAPNGRRDHGRLPARPKRSRKQLPLIAGLAGAHLRPGASVRVTVSKRGYRGIGKRYGIRDGQRVKACGYRLGGKRPRC
jgi:hypothetical protein